jgi:hypothetical protein
MAGLLNVSMMWLINSEGEGVEVPELASGVSSNDTMRDLMTEMRDLRADLLSRAEQVGRLEKRMRAAMQAPTGG